MRSSTGPRNNGADERITGVRALPQAPNNPDVAHASHVKVIARLMCKARPLLVGLFYPKIYNRQLSTGDAF